MPLVRVDMIEGRRPEEIGALMNGVHKALRSQFNIPLRDRHQVVNQYSRDRFLAAPFGLGAPRTRDCVVIQVTTRPYPREAKERFCELLVQELASTCGLAPADIVVSMVTNADAEQPLSNMQARPVTGELEEAG